MPKCGVDVGPDHERAVARACGDAIAEPTASNVVRVADLKESDPVRSEFEFSEHGIGVHVGKVLAAAEWAQELGRGKYRIRAEQLPR